MLRFPQIAVLLIATFGFQGDDMAARAVPEDQIIGTILEQRDRVPDPAFI